MSITEERPRQAESLRDRALAELKATRARQDEADALQYLRNRETSGAKLQKLLRDVLEVEVAAGDLQFGETGYAFVEIDGLRFSGGKWLYLHGDCPKCGEPAFQAIFTLGHLGEVVEHGFTPDSEHNESCDGLPSAVAAPASPSCTPAERNLLDALAALIAEGGAA